MRRVTELREQVLASSLALIEEQGVAALSLREVARRAGVSHQAPYHHFGSKDALVAELVGRGFTRLSEMLESAERTRGTPARRLRLAARAYVDFALANPAAFRIMFRPELADLSACPSAGAAGSRAYSVLVRLVDENFRGPRVGPDRLEAITTMHWSMVHGLSTLLLDGSLGKRARPARDTEALIDRTLDLFSRTAGRQR
ncbi:MAG: TetR/AcrR family transcriptional regulator [Phycisphaerales bacterium]|nr:TetR/AcrR family transcriptional regulator [Phycisphaerales bacterium]